MQITLVGFEKNHFFFLICLGMNRMSCSMQASAKAPYCVRTVSFFLNNPAEDNNINIISNPTRIKKQTNKTPPQNNKTQTLKKVKWTKGKKKADKKKNKRQKFFQRQHLYAKSYFLPLILKKNPSGLVLYLIKQEKGKQGGFLTTVCNSQPELPICHWSSPVQTQGTDRYVHCQTQP